MEVSQIKNRLEQLLGELEIPFYAAFENKKINTDRTIAFIYEPTSEIDDEVLSRDAQTRYIRKKHHFTLEITGSGDTEADSRRLFDLLTKEADFFNLSLNKLSLSKITRLKSVLITFDCFESFTADYGRKDSDRYFSGFGYNLLVENVSLQDDLFTPSVVLASGERYYADSSANHGTITVTCKIPTSLAYEFFQTCVSSVNELHTIAVDKKAFTVNKTLGCEIIKSNSFSSTFKLTLKLSDSLLSE